MTAVVPARNEEATIGTVVRECFNYAGKVIVVEGGSSDRTAEVAAAAGAVVVRDRRRRGPAPRRPGRLPGHALVDAGRIACGDPTISDEVALKTGQADHVTGSRLLGGSTNCMAGKHGLLRLAGSAFIDTNRCFGTRLSDLQNEPRRFAPTSSEPSCAPATTTELEMMPTPRRALGLNTQVPTHERLRAVVAKISRAGLDPDLGSLHGRRLPKAAGKLPGQPPA